VVILLLLLAVVADAQPIGDGVPLLRQMSEWVRSATGWRASFYLEISSEPVIIPAFGSSGAISKRRPLELNYAYAGGFSRTICDGTTLSSRMLPFSGPNPQETEFRTPATLERCNPLALRWDNLLDSLVSAALDGSDRLAGCTLVRAEYMLPDGLGRYFPTEPILSPVITREMCIDEARLVILYERYEGPTSHFAHSIVTYRYQDIERDPEFGPDEFAVPPPLSAAAPPAPLPLRTLESLSLLP
jgi:hypothetical protein